MLHCSGGKGRHRAGLGSEVTSQLIWITRIFNNLETLWSIDPHCEVSGYMVQSGIKMWHLHTVSGKGFCPKNIWTHPKYTWWHGLGLAFIWELPQGHGKVISRSQQGQISSKWLKIAYFGCFCYNYAHLSCLWWLKTYPDSNTDLYQNNLYQVIGVI